MELNMRWGRIGSRSYKCGIYCLDVPKHPLPFLLDVGQPFILDLLFQLCGFFVQQVKWMMYWIIFALFTTAETFTDIFLCW